MTDILIRDVPDDVAAALDARAARLGLSRSEYVRRQWAQEAGRSDAQVTPADLAAFARTFHDLGNPDVLRDAWSCVPGSSTSRLSSG
jgi:plasmid stability protein